MYITSAIFEISVASVVSVVGTLYYWWNDPIIEWVCTFAVHNTYVIMFAYFHWPYEGSDDQYDDGRLESTFTNEIDEDYHDDQEGMLSNQDFDSAGDAPRENV